MHLVKNVMARLAEVLSHSFRLWSCKYKLYLGIRIRMYIGSGIATDKVLFVFIRIIYMDKDQSNIMVLAESHATFAKGWKILQD